MLTMGSLFDGIGGFPLAAVRNGITPLWASEIEAFPIEVTKIRFPEMLHAGDITKLNGANLPPVDIICGGSPCQDLSVAGARRGLAGERSGLFMEQTRIAKEMRKADEQRSVPDHLVRPRYLVWENVPGAFSSANGEDFRAVIEEIIRIKDSACDVPRPDTGRWESAGAAFLGDGFSLAWRVLDAQFWGVAQRRRRIFLVADFGGCTAPEILFKQDGLFGDTAQSRNSWEGIAAPAQGGSYDSSRACLTPWDVQSRRIFEETGTWPALYGGEGGGHGYIKTEEKKPMAFAANQRDEVRDLHGVAGALQAQLGMKQQTFINQEMLCLNDHGGQRMDITKEVTPTLRAGMGGHPPLISQPNCLNGWDTQQSRVFIAEGVAPTLAGADGGGGRNPAGLLFAAGVVTKGDGDCFLIPETHTSLTKGGGQAGQGYPCVLYENHGMDSRYTGPHAVAPTISARAGTGGNNLPLVGTAVAFSLDSKKSNNMKSTNSHSGCRETDLARTLDTTNPDLSKNQSGIAILQETLCIAGNTIDRQPQNGGNGLGCQPDVAYTLTATDHHAVYSRQRSDEFCENEVVATQSARQHKDATDLICQPEVFGQSQFGNYAEGCSTLRAQGGDNGGGSENLALTQAQNTRQLIRRLTPLECERLQGFPDGWTLIPGASNSARYKALGNSVAIPCVEFLMRGIAYFLSLSKEESYV